MIINGEPVVNIEMIALLKDLKGCKEWENRLRRIPYVYSDILQDLNIIKSVIDTNGRSLAYCLINETKRADLLKTIEEFVMSFQKTKDKTNRLSKLSLKELDEGIDDEEQSEMNVLRLELDIPKYKRNFSR